MHGLRFDRHCQHCQYFHWQTMKKSFCQVPLCLSAAAGSDALARRQGNEARGEKNSSFADGRMEFSFDLVPNL